MTHIAIADLSPAVITVDLWGKEFTVATATRAVGKAEADLIENQGEMANDDDFVASLAARLDLRLKPVSGSKKASSLVLEKWQADELTVRQLLGLFDSIVEAESPN